MKIDISARHFQLGGALKDHIEGKVDRLEKYSLKIEKAHVILEVQKFRQMAEIELSGKNLRLTAKSQDSDMYKAFDECFGKIQLQIQRKHDKVRDHKARRYTAKTSSKEE